MNSPRSVVICHVYNEELLLPYWLAHHRRLFDHGVILDYASTDRTAEVVRESGLDWELRRSRNASFEPLAVDAEVMDVEAEFGEGVWKMAINVTEHLFASRLDTIIAGCPPDIPAIAFEVASMIDPPSHRGLPLDPRFPLYLQRHHGVLGRRKARFLHRAARGQYRVGRHRTDLPTHRVDKLVLWWGYSPFDAIKARKLQIGARMPASVPAPWGSNHRVDEAGLERLYDQEQADLRDLLGEPRFADALLEICREWPDWGLAAASSSEPKI